MRVWVKGSNQQIDLTQRNYIAAGGQGTVYARQGVGFKVYHNANDMLPLGKISELKAIQDPHIVKPEDLLTDKAGTPIGYTTKFVDDAYTLCQLFPRAFRERNALDNNGMKELIRKMRESIANVHKAQVLIVDLNEMNFLVDKTFNDIYFIDTDSYQTPHYPATAIMDSIRDWTVKGQDWTTNTDWYSFAILSFQMFCGIHPFKGRYKGAKTEFKTKLPTDDPNDAFAVTRRRMLAGISVLHPEVGVPDVAYPVSVIPKGYQTWYEAVFTQGKRCAPPMDFGAFTFQPAVTAAVSATAKLDIAEVGSFTGAIESVWSDGRQIVVRTADTVWLDGQQIRPPSRFYLHTGFSPKGARVIQVDSSGKIPQFYNVTDRTPIPFNLQVREVSDYDGRLYVRTDDRVHEVILTDAGTQVIASTKEIAQTLPHATRLFPGVIVQRLLGSTFLSLLSRSGTALQVQVKELDAYRILDAKFDRGVLMLVGEQKGQYDRIVMRFDDAGNTEPLRIIRDITPAGLNFVTLDSGVCISMTEEEKLEVFSSRPGSTGLKVVEDPILGGDMTLARQGGTLLFARGNKLYKMKMR